MNLTESVRPSKGAPPPKKKKRKSRKEKKGFCLQCVVGFSLLLLWRHSLREKSSDWMERRRKDGVTSHPEEVLVAVVLVPFPVGCRVVTVVKARRTRFAALPLPV